MGSKLGSIITVAMLAIIAGYFLAQRSPVANEAHDGFKMDLRTGLEFPTKASFSVGKSLELVGVGTRTKAGIVKVYSVGFYCSAGAVKSSTGPDALKRSKGPKVLQLTFAMGVDEKKVADALSAVIGVKADVLAAFKDIILMGIGGKMARGETMTLEFDGPNLAVTVRGASAGKIKDRALADGVLELYLGGASVSPTLKEDIRAVLTRT